MKRTLPAIALLLAALMVAAAGCTTVTPSSTTGVPTTSSASPTTSVSGTTAATTTTATSGGHAPGSRTAVAPATLGGCSPSSSAGYNGSPMDQASYGQYNQFTSYPITVFSRNYFSPSFAPQIILRVVDTVYDINVVKAQMPSSEGNFWGLTVDDATNYAAARSSHGYPGWEYRNKANGDAWVGVDIGNGIYLYAYSTPAYSITLDLATLRSFVDGLNLGCWAALAPA